MERKLATLRRIKKLIPIEGADAIELALVDGWQVVVAKNVGYQQNDLVIYCEIDSFLPIREEFEFLRRTSYKKMADREGFLLKTIRLRGQISQGLILPITVLGDNTSGLYEGMDVTEKLGIVKYEAPIPASLQGKVKGSFPSFIPKTDEERVQNLEKEYNQLIFSSKHQLYVTEKLDGSSYTAYFNRGQFGVCSRNLELLETEGNTYWKVTRDLKIEEKLRSLGRNISLQGELIGEGIQGNPYKLRGQTVKFFTGYDIDSGRRIPIREFLDLLKKLELESVPVLHLGDFILPQTIPDMLKWADGPSQLNPNFPREGVVVRSLDGTVSFKAISNQFLLKTGG
jgi:RNA ligase (TIGR02306 family)